MKNHEVLLLYFEKVLQTSKKLNKYFKNGSEFKNSHEKL